MTTPVLEVITLPPTVLEVLSGPTPVFELLFPGPRGPQGEPGSGTVHFEHTQATPAAAWIIVHNFGRNPSVTLIIDGRVEYTEIVHPDLNTTTVYWPAPTAGRALIF